MRLQYLVRFAHSSLKVHAPQDGREESWGVVEHKAPCKNLNRARNGMETGTSLCASLYVKQKILLTYLNLPERFFTAPAACTAAQGGDASWARDSDDDVKSSKRICVRAEKGEVLGGECGNHYSSVAVDQQQPVNESNITKREFAL
uniref:Uncharacterized protein n=1 Tax=Ixodes ricinus TaxID=34613 RepID=A0A147BG37_IXORI